MSAKCQKQTSAQLCRERQERATAVAVKIGRDHIHDASQDMNWRKRQPNKAISCKQLRCPSSFRTYAKGDPR